MFYTEPITRERYDGQTFENFRPVAADATPTAGRANVQRPDRDDRQRLADAGESTETGHVLFIQDPTFLRLAVEQNETPSDRVIVRGLRCKVIAIESHVTGPRPHQRVLVSQEQSIKSDTFPGPVVTP